MACACGPHAILQLVNQWGTACDCARVSTAGTCTAALLAAAAAAVRIPTACPRDKPPAVISTLNRHCSHYKYPAALNGGANMGPLLFRIARASTYHVHHQYTL